MTVSHDAEHFRRLYARSADPWGFRTSGYEQEKYRRTIATLGERRFRSGFEPGCSIGVLTRMLATRCDALLAADIVESHCTRHAPYATTCRGSASYACAFRLNGPTAASI